MNCILWNSNDWKKLKSKYQNLYKRDLCPLLQISHIYKISIKSLLGYSYTFILPEYPKHSLFNKSGLGLCNPAVKTHCQIYYLGHANRNLNRGYN